MSRQTDCNRRTFSKGLAASALAAPALVSLKGAAALAQVAAPAGNAAETWKELERLSISAQNLGLSVPRMSLGPETMTANYADTLPAVVDLMDSLDTGIAEPGLSPQASADAEALREQASDLLGKINAVEKFPREEPPGEAGGPSASASFKIPKFEDIAENYRMLFKTVKIRDDRRDKLAWYVGKLTEEARRAAYQKIEDEACLPWYFVGVIHGMECGYDLRKHLHNGDPLKYKTVQIPRNRPEPWNPPTDWHSSAIDALKYDKLLDLKDWNDIARVLFRWEGYNGWRSRVLYGINTPYLWSFSNHYTKGKFVADNVWDGNAVSQQPGAAVLLKMLIEQGSVGEPA
jgi:lysozyme family protein